MHTPDPGGFYTTSFWSCSVHMCFQVSILFHKFEAGAATVDVMLPSIRYVAVDVALVGDGTAAPHVGVPFITCRMR
jgi:hypothetical protein